MESSTPPINADSSASLLDRSQRVLSLSLVFVLLVLVLGISSVIFKQQSHYLEEAFYRRAAALSQNLSTVAMEELLKAKDGELSDKLWIAKMTDDAIVSNAFYNADGALLASSGRPVDLPFDSDNIQSVVTMRDYEIGLHHIFIHPVKNRNGDFLGVAYLRMTKEGIRRNAFKATLILNIALVIAFLILGFLINRLLSKIKFQANAEATRTSELRQAYERLQSLQSQLVQAEKLSALGRLSSGIGHELRNPLSAIKNAVYYIKDFLVSEKLIEKDPTLDEFLTLIDKEINRSLRLLADILDYARSVKIHRELCDINKLIGYLHHTVQTPAHIQYHEELEPSLQPVLIDEGRIQQVLTNLITNAILAMPQKGDLYVRTRKEDRLDKPWYLIDIEDTGCGMPPEVLQRIFEPMFTTRSTGNGFGLAISLAILKAHGGTIKVTSQQGKGSVFSVQFPAEF